jgi:4-oxalomesaconate tautomerase
MHTIPDHIERVLQQSDNIKQATAKYIDRENWLFLGRGYNYPVALEGALKLKEISYIHAEGMPAAEMKHGPIALIDNGMPVVIMLASDLGVTGYESRDELNANAALKQRIESIRLQAGPAMNLGDVTKKVVPKMCLVAKPRSGKDAIAGHISTRTFIPHDCHSAVGVLGAVTVATAAVTAGTVAHRVAEVPAGLRKTLSVQHPSGEFTVVLEMNPANPAEVARASLLRTARLIMGGEVFIPGDIWPVQHK